MIDLTPNSSFSLTIRFQVPNRPGMLAGVTQAISSLGGNLGQIDLIEQTRKISVRDITVDAASEDHAETIIEAVKALPHIRVMNVYDRTFQIHRGGKICVEGKIGLKNQADLAMAYTPGVGRVCSAIAQDPSKVYTQSRSSRMAVPF
jgi:malate dehydrogenase (oxaloacetate-decarboxylating)